VRSRYVARISARPLTRSSSIRAPEECLRLARVALGDDVFELDPLVQGCECASDRGGSRVDPQLLIRMLEVLPNIPTSDPGEDLRLAVREQEIAALLVLSPRLGLIIRWSLVRIQAGPNRTAPPHRNRMDACVGCAGRASFARRVRTPVRTPDSAAVVASLVIRLVLRNQPLRSSDSSSSRRCA
jgi:hypothetical protein